MHLSRRVLWQLAFFALVTLVAGVIMGFGVLNLPRQLFGIGEYHVTVQLPATGGLYPTSNVTYRGTEVGRVESVTMTPAGVDAKLSLTSGRKIPADLDAQVHSVTAVGEQYVELVPRSANGPALQNGDVIPVDRTTLPPDINALLSATNRGLLAIPNDNLKTAMDEGYLAFGGLGPELSRIVKGSTALAIDARKNLDSLTTLIDQSKPILDTQIDTSDSIQAWAASVAQITREVQTQDPAVRGILANGPDAADEASQLFGRLQPTLPILLNNLVSLTDVAVVYNSSLEQLLALAPRSVEQTQATGLANRDTKQDYAGVYLSFKLNLNVPPPCTTGFLPATQRRSPSEQDYPERPAGDMYCRVPQDSALNVRGARNTPCITRPGKRAPTVKMCESDQNYVPLNDGYNWKGDPNATLSGQPVPAPRDPNANLSAPVLAAPPPQPADAAPPPPLAVAEYDPATGSYIGPDGKLYTQSNLAANAPQHSTWQDLLVPPGS